MKKVFFILLFFALTKISHSQTILIEYNLNPNKPKKKAVLKDTFLIIKNEPNKEINFEDYELGLYNIKVKTIPDTSIRPEIKGFIKSYQFKTQKGTAFYRGSNFSKNHFSDSIYTTYAFLYNSDNGATYMNYYYTIDRKRRLIQYKADCYAQKDFIEYKYSDTDKLIQIDDNGRHITMEYKGNLIQRIYSYEWDSEKKRYIPVSFIEVKRN